MATLFFLSSLVGCFVNGFSSNNSTLIADVICVLSLIVAFTLLEREILRKGDIETEAEALYQSDENTLGVSSLLSHKFF